MNLSLMLGTKKQHSHDLSRKYLKMVLLLHDTYRDNRFEFLKVIFKNSKLTYTYAKLHHAGNRYVTDMFHIPFLEVAYTDSSNWKTTSTRFKEYFLKSGDVLYKRASSNFDPELFKSVVFKIVVSTEDPEENSWPHLVVGQYSGPSQENLSILCLKELNLNSIMKYFHWFKNFSPSISSVEEYLGVS